MRYLYTSVYELAAEVSPENRSGVDLRRSLSALFHHGCHRWNRKVPPPVALVSIEA